MRYALLIFFVLFWAVLSNAETCICKTNLCRTNEAIKAIRLQLEKKAAPKAVPASELAPAILRASLKYGLDYHLLTAVILVESRGVSTAYNKKTNDHGLGQINIKTARAMGLTMTCLYNWKCNLNATASILSSLNDGRICRYNLGTAKLLGNRFEKCTVYERKVVGMF